LEAGPVWADLYWRRETLFIYVPPYRGGAAKPQGDEFLDGEQSAVRQIIEHCDAINDGLFDFGLFGFCHFDLLF